jgi:hypothetical protein
MLGAGLLLLTCTVLAGQPALGDGTIAGRVVNGSQGKNRPCQTTVLLRIQSDGQFTPFRETVSNAQGIFRFSGLPVGDGARYLVGANQNDVHYPGPRISLTAAAPSALAELTVYDAVTHPSPLVIRDCEITLRPEPGALRVTESMVVDNPSSSSYVGKAAEPGAEPVTLQLAIPADFDQATFREEFYGRRFFVFNGKVVTGIPWPPGQRELKFTYVLRNAQRHRVWERPLDLPCSELRIRVLNEPSDQITCNLPTTLAAATGEIAFQSAGQVLSAGHVLRVGIGHLPVPWITYARGLAAAALICALVGTSMVMIRRRVRNLRARGDHALRSALPRMDGRSDRRRRQNTR